MFGNAKGILGNYFGGDEGRIRVGAIGKMLGQLSQGQAPDATPALQLLDDRRAQKAFKASMSDPGMMDKFSPQEREFLATLPPQAAQSLIAQRVFAPPPAPPAPIEINGQLVDPITRQVLGDYRTPEGPTGTFQALEERALAAGLQPGTPEYRDFMLEGGGDAVNVTTNVNTGESAFDKKTGEVLATEAATIVEQGMAAQRNLGTLTTLEQALANSPQGAAGAWASLAGEFGIKTEGASDIELANALINQLVPQQRPPGSGQMSDADLALFKQSLPRLINTPGGNQKILATMRAIADYDVQRMGIARNLQLGKISQEDAFAQYAALGNPVAEFLESTSAPSGPPQAGLVEDGYRFKGGNPADPANWERVE